MAGCNFSPKDEARERKPIEHTIEPRAVIKNQQVHKQIDTGAYVADIAKYCDSVDRQLNHFILKTVDDPDKSGEGGEQNYYLDAKDTVKVTAIYYGETGKTAYTLYFKNGMIALLNQEVTFYTAPIYVKDSKPDRLETERVTFKDGKIVQWINKGTKVGSIEFDKKDAELKDLYIELFR
ncbi:hypothetical protein [Pedobacter metabolipauper]|nr:hypothetical protein [Pedobacter metabolipauper]